MLMGIGFDAGRVWKALTAKQFFVDFAEFDGTGLNDARDGMGDSSSRRTRTEVWLSYGWDFISTVVSICMCAAFTLKCLAYEVYVLGSNEQSYLSSLLFSFPLIHQPHAFSPDWPPGGPASRIPMMMMGPPARARPQRRGIISFILSFYYRVKRD